MRDPHHVERVDRRICDTSGCGSAPPRASLAESYPALISSAWAIQLERRSKGVARADRGDDLEHWLADQFAGKAGPHRWRAGCRRCAASIACTLDRGGCATTPRS